MLNLIGKLIGIVSSRKIYHSMILYRIIEATLKGDEEAEKEEKSVPKMTDR